MYQQIKNGNFIKDNLKQGQIKIIEQYLAKLNVVKGVVIGVIDTRLHANKESLSHLLERLGLYKKPISKLTPTCLKICK